MGKLVRTANINFRNGNYACEACGKDIRTHETAYSAPGYSGTKYRCEECSITLLLTEEEEITEFIKTTNKIRRYPEPTKTDILHTNRLPGPMKYFDCDECGTDIREYTVTYRRIWGTNRRVFLCMICAVKLKFIDEGSINEV